MKIGIIESAFRRQWGENRFQKLRDCGFDAVDYDLMHTHVFLYSCNEQNRAVFLSEERERIEQAGLTVSQVHGPWRWPCDDATLDARTERFEKMVLAIQMAAALGSKRFVIHPLMPFGTDDIGSGNEQATFDINIAFWQELLPIAKQNNVIICLETMPFVHFSLSTPAQILKVVQTINDPYFKACLDTGHTAMCGTLSVGDAVRLLGDALCVLHVHDNNGRADQHALPYSGVVDWADVGAALREIGFDGVFSLETAPPEKLPKQFREPATALVCKVARSIVHNG